jgi:hypothetical protein
VNKKGARALAVGASVAAGVVGGIATNMVTNQWSWTWAAALVLTAISAIVLQVWLTLSDGSSAVIANGRASVAAGRSVKGSLEIHSSGPSASPTSLDVGGISAQGPGSIAAGKDVKGKIRIRSTDR